jgi:phage-related protein
MWVLSNIVIFIVDMLSYAVFRAIAVVAVALIHTLKAPGTAILAVLENVMQGFTTILDYMLVYVTDLIVKSALECVRLILDALSALVGSLGTVFYEFLVYLHTALLDFAELVGEFLWNLIQMLGLSLLTIWNNLVDAVASFIGNL